MVIATQSTEGEANTTPLELPDGGVDAPNLRYFVMALFFIFGGITSLNDVIIPKLKELFTLNYTQAMLVQFCFFTAYLVIGIPGAQLVKKIGYMRGAVVGLLTMMVGCLLFIPASATATYGLFLLALFVLASGVVVVQVVANPLISLLGPAEDGPQPADLRAGVQQPRHDDLPARRLGADPRRARRGRARPQLSGAALDQYRTDETRAIVRTYIGLAVALAVIAAVVWAVSQQAAGREARHSPPLAGFSLLKRTRFGFGALCIFLYVGGEVSIGSLIVNYLMQQDVLGTTAAARRQDDHVLLGRRDGRPLHRLILPAHAEPGQDAGDRGRPARSCCSRSRPTPPARRPAYSLLAIGLMNSIMFPTIFSLACEKLGPRAADGSGIINIAIFGGAVVPVLTGLLADKSGSLHFAMLLPALCYAVICAFGIYARRPAEGPVMKALTA